MVKLILLSMLVPTLVFAECLEWILCPYIVEQDASRRLDLPQGSTWEGIEVAGNQALVCMQSELTAKQRADAGCTPVTRGNLKTHMIEPPVSYYDEATGSIKFKDGKEGRPSEVSAFSERNLMRKFRDDPAFQRGVPK